MSVPTYYTRHSWLNDTQIAHPDPLRSNSNHKEHIRPDSQVLDPIYNAWPSNASVHPAFRLSAAQRFNHADTARFDDPTLPVIPPKSVLRKSASSDAWRNSGPVDYDIPKVPTRPPLRPTVSFGSVSYCSDMSSVLEEKSLKVEAQKQEEQQQRQSWKSFTCLVCLCLLNFVCALGATSLSAALPIMANDLHMTGVQTFWIVTSYLLTATVFQPTFTSISHVLGIKPILLLAITAFSAGSIICALASNLAALLVGRSFEGIGAAGVTALTHLIIFDTVSPGEQDPWSNAVTLQWILATMVGPIFGGLLAEKASWHSIFWVLFSLSIVGLITILWLLEAKSPEGLIRDKLRKIDWLGTATFTGFSTLLIISVSWGGVSFAWNSWQTLAPFIIGVAGMLFFIYCCRYPDQLDPVFPATLFRSATAIVSHFGTVAHSMVMFSMLYMMPLYFGSAQGYSTALSGLALLPWTFIMGLSAVLVGFFMSRTGRYRWAIWAGWALTILAVGLMVLVKATGTAAQWVPLSVFCGLGLGILYPALSSATKASASDGEEQHAVVLHGFSRSCGQTLGAAISAATFQNQIKLDILSYTGLAEHAKSYANNAVALVELVRDMPAATPLRTDLAASYANALRPVWVLMCVLSGIAFILAIWFTEDCGLDRSMFHMEKRRRSSHQVYELDGSEK